jgi:hypothetical protein
METNTGQEKDKSTIMAFRMPETKREELLKRAKPNETKSVLLRRVVDTFLKVTKRQS